MKNIDFKLLKELSSEVKEALVFLDNENYFNMALMYGLTFGIFGGLFATIVYNELIIDLSSTWQIVWYILISLVLGFFLFIGLIEFRKVKKKKQELEQQKKKVLEQIKKREKKCIQLDCKFDEYIENHECIKLDCGHNQYPKNHECKEYECIDDKSCNYDEYCSDHECNKLICVFGYPKHHECISYWRYIIAIITIIIVGILVSLIIYSKIKKTVKKKINSKHKKKK
ncbi:unnamed protein product, partial [marine sediment metagenome]